MAKYQSYEAQKRRYYERVRDFLIDYARNFPEAGAVPYMKIKQILHHSSASGFIDVVMGQLGREGYTGEIHMADNEKDRIVYYGPKLLVAALRPADE